MDFSDTPDEAGFRNEVRAFLERHAEPRRGTFETWQSRYPDREGLERAKDFQRKRADAGLAGLHWPKAYGGREAPRIFQVILAQEEASYLVPRGYFEIGLGMCMPTLFTYATEEQRRRYAPAALRGDESVVPALLGARRGLRPGRAAHARGSRWQRLGHQRPEDLDVGRALGRLRHPGHAQRSQDRPSTRASPSSSCR